MKKQASLFRKTLGFIILTAPAFAHGQTSETPGYLADYRYQVANLSSYSEAQAIMDLETAATRSNSVCSSRAEIWSFIMNKKTQIQVGKVFIHFTAKGKADENKEWAYHVAPYLLVNGKEVVMDRAFVEFNQKPTPLSNWTLHFGKSQNCIVLDPVNNPKHLKLEKNNLFADTATPFTNKNKPARQYPDSEGICYIRKAPMYYGTPADVYAADLALSGKNEYRQFVRSTFLNSDVLDSCKKAMTMSARFAQSCSDYLGINE